MHEAFLDFRRSIQQIALPHIIHLIHRSMHMFCLKFHFWQYSTFSFLAKELPIISDYWAYLDHVAPKGAGL